jgi:hypothetical protein
VNDRNKRWLVILQAYIDESGTGNTRQEPYFALAGFISTSENWANFSTEWQKELDNDPPIKCFKMRQAFAKQGPFKGLNTEDIDQRVTKFIEIIKSYAMVRVSTTIDKRGYDQFIKGKLDIPSEIDSPYFWCFYQLIYAIIVYQRRHEWNTRIDFIFDEIGKLGPETIRWYPLLKKLATPAAKPYIGSPPIFRDDEQFLPLQAADLYAWLVRRKLYENKTICMPMLRELKEFHNMQCIERSLSAKQLSNHVFKTLFPKTFP